MSLDDDKNFLLLVYSLFFIIIVYYTYNYCGISIVYYYLIPCLCI